jgi:YihY family inner membrane protein
LRCELSASDRLDAFQRRHRWASFPIAVIYKFGEDQGPYLAALITYYGFLALFPLLLLLTSILGFVLQGDPDLQRRILDSTLSQFPVIGDVLGDSQGLQGSGIALVVGGVIALYGALGVAQAIQNAMNVAWAVPKHRRPNPLRIRLRSLLVIVIGGGAALATTVLSALASSAGAFGADLAAWTTVVFMIAAVVVNAGVFLLVFRVSTAHATTMRDLIPGAITAALIWQTLQLFGTAYVGNIVKNAGPAYGVFALVLGLFAWIYFGAVGVVVSAEINVVRAKRLYPRSLMTPFTDNVDLTAADRHAYTDSATAQKAKGFENVAVSFDHDGQQATARRDQRRATSAAAAKVDDRERPRPRSR